MYSDKDFKNDLGKDFRHEDMISREGWAMCYFDGVYPADLAYIKLEIVNPQSNQLIRTMYFQFRKSYKTTFDAKSYVVDPVLGTKIVQNGILTELRPVKNQETGAVRYVKAHTTFKRDGVIDMLSDSPKRVKVDTEAIIRTQVRYSEKPKMVFLVTPPHLITENF